MRTLAVVSVALTACLGVVPACVAAPPQIVLADPGYPLWEMRPLDRRVYVLTLEGDWKVPPDPDALYDMNIEYPGGTVTHRPPYERSFRRGDVQCLLVQYQWEKNQLQTGDKLTVFITQRKAGSAPDNEEVISNRLEVSWPFDRRVVRVPPKTRYSEPEPIDNFPLRGPEPTPPKLGPLPVPIAPPGEEPLKPPTPAPGTLPPPRPVPTTLPPPSDK